MPSLLLYGSPVTQPLCESPVTQYLIAHLAGMSHRLAPDDRHKQLTKLLAELKGVEVWWRGLGNEEIAQMYQIGYAAVVNYSLVQQLSYCKPHDIISFHETTLLPRILPDYLLPAYPQNTLGPS